MNFSVFPSVKCLTSQNELTKPSLTDLLGRKSERGEKFDRYLHENVRQGWRRRDLGINPKPAEEALERRKQINQRVIAGADVFDRLRELGSRRHNEIGEGTYSK